MGIERYLPPSNIFEAPGRTVRYFDQAKYRREIKSIADRAVTKAAAKQLAREVFAACYHAEGVAARNRLATANRGLVGMVVRKWKFPNEGDYDDAFQAGVFGLIRAIEKWQPGIAQLSTYAVWWIRQFVYRWNETQGLISIPNGTLEKREPRSEKEASRFAASARARGPLASLDAMPVNISDRSVMRHDPEPLEGLHPAVRLLPPRLRKIIHLRFFEGLTLEETASKIGVTKQRVDQLAHKALKRLKTAIEARAKAS